LHHEPRHRSYTTGGPVATITLNRPEALMTEGRWDPGRDFALCADLVVASEDAVIDTPYSRMCGAYLSGMWIYRLGRAKASSPR
jgi:enoyl-CoA hydratase/carnithine racemase